MFWVRLSFDLKGKVMKYYFPTTTLNFDSIVSSQLISPAGMYRPDTLWWNHFETVLGQRKDAIVLYNRIPTWRINDLDRDNYPLVVEMDKVFPKSYREEFDLGKSLKAVVVSKPITFSAWELEQGKVRFIFQTDDEKERMITKVSTGTDECKLVRAMQTDISTAFTIVPAKTKTVSLEEASEKLACLLKVTSDTETLEYPTDLIETERERGAELGYRIGRYANSLRFGAFTDAFRSPLTYEEWKEKVLSEPFAAILEKLCRRPIQVWDPNRRAIVDFCATIWKDCFDGRKVSGKKIGKGAPLHESLQKIAWHWKDPEKVYQISSEQNPYLQAFAAFLECGDRADKYRQIIREEAGLQKVEYLLALYGALVGYTLFSRVLLDNEVYLSPSEAEVLGEGRSGAGTKSAKWQVEKKPHDSSGESTSTERRSVEPIGQNTEQLTLNFKNGRDTGPVKDKS